MPTLTGHGGVHEIGGNAFLLDDGRSRVFLDLGKRFGSDRLVEEQGLRPGWSDYFDEFLKPRTFRFVPDLLALGLAPDVPGIYRQDLGGDGGPQGVDAVVVSHAHMDHVGLVGLLRPEIPIVATGQSKAILGSIQETGQAGPESDFLDTKARGRVVRKKDGSLTTSSSQVAAGPPRTFRCERKTQAGDWTIEAHPVDHSIAGAMGAIVTGGISVAYSGDFRLHGRHAQDSQRFLERAGGCDVLVVEGTRVHRPSDEDKPTQETDREEDVEAEVERLVARHGDGFVAVSYPPRDIDRLVSMHRVAKRTGRRLVLATKQAHLLEALRAAGRDDLPDPRTDAHLAVHLRAHKKGTILERGAIPVARPDLGVDAVEVSEDERAALLASEHDPWERPYLDWANTVTSPGIGAEPHAYLMGLGFFSITELLDVFPGADRPGGLYVHSQTQPFNDDMVVTGRKLDRWLRAFGLTKASTHVSGHLSAEHLEWALDEVRPRLLVPVHTHAPDWTAGRYEGRGGQAALPVAGRPIELG